MPSNATRRITVWGVRTADAPLADFLIELRFGNTRKLPTYALSFEALGLFEELHGLPHALDDLGVVDRKLHGSILSFFGSIASLDHRLLAKEKPDT